MTEIPPVAPHVTDADTRVHVDAPRTWVTRDPAGVPVLHLEWRLQQEHSRLDIPFHRPPGEAATSISGRGIRLAVRDTVDEAYIGRVGMLHALHLMMRAVDADAIADHVQRAWDEMPPAARAEL